MGQVLYRKYRSRTWNEVVGQDHVTTTLKHAIDKNIISHAYLFTGPRGVGKTSVARILAYAVNGIPYSDTIQLDIIEIDAASNRRIDEIRELRDRIHITPTSAKYKVYIIDEVHMLTREAFNALLKILEEPPEHAIFILATTEPQKLPETIISRTQRFSFHPIGADLLTEHLRSIAKTEKITIDDDALRLIAEHGDGSFRDSISLLDQVRGYNKKITVDEVRDLVGDVPGKLLNKIIKSIVMSDRSEIVTLLQSLLAEGYEPARIAKQMAALVRQVVLGAESLINRNVSLSLLKKLIDIPASIEPGISLEIALLETVDDKIPVNRLSSSAIKEVQESHPKVKTVEKKVSSQTIETGLKSPKELQAKDHPEQSSKVDIEEPDILWAQLLDVIKKDHNTLYGILRMAKPDFSGTVLTLNFGFKFHQQKVKEDRNCHIISKILFDLSARDYTIECVLDDSVRHEIPVDVNVATETVHVENNNEQTLPLETINSIFGGGEIIG
jgi:DNA polymerase-3 subunit gamma/tau